TDAVETRAGDVCAHLHAGPQLVERDAAVVVARGGGESDDEREVTTHRRQTLRVDTGRARIGAMLLRNAAAAASIAALASAPVAAQPRFEVSFPRTAHAAPITG